MPPQTTFGSTTLAMTLGTVLTTGCTIDNGDSESTSEVSGADYGGPDTADWGNDEVETDSSSDSSTETETETSTTDTETATGTDTGSPTCGWDPVQSIYACGFEGVDPGGIPIDCPVGLVEGDPCATTGLTAQGCCDAGSANWFCSLVDGAEVVALDACG